MKRKYSNEQIKKAGKILTHRENYSPVEISFAEEVLTYWRIIHDPLINTFQASLRQKLNRNYKGKGFVAQRLKRSESIITKLQRINTMKLSTMQDIAGLRVVLNDIKHVFELAESLRKSKSKHNLIDFTDYISKPKESGYRSIHLIFEFINESIPESNNLKIEIQVRSTLQHIWATSVETLGTFLKTSLKSSQGPQEILDFFSLVSSGFAILENCNTLNKHELFDKETLFLQIITEYDELKIWDKLNAFRIVANHIEVKGINSKYYLIRLDIDNKNIRIKHYKKEQFEIANKDYTLQEKEIFENKLNAQVVLVSLESIKSLKKAYPNYFLDTNDFNKQIEKIRHTTKNWR